MKSYFKWALVLVISLVIIMTLIYENTTKPLEKQDIFNREELEWIEKHPIVKIGLDPEYAPFEYYEDGVFLGMSIDYLEWFHELTGLSFDLVKYNQFSDVLKAVYEKEIDMTGGVIRTKDRIPFMEFTDTFYSNFDIILIREDSELISEDDLVNVKTGAIEGYSVVGYLKEKFPTIDLVEVSDVTEGLQKLSFGELDAFVTDFSQASYYIYLYGYNNIKALESSKLSIDGNLRFGVRKDYETLVSILNKALQNMPSDFKSETQQKWIGLKVNPLITDEVLIVIIIGFVVLIVIVLSVVFINRILKREIKIKTLQLQNELERAWKAEKNLQYMNETLEQQVRSRTKELELLIDDLRETKDKAIQAEKMAFLGNLVAGVAHEINSPLGVVLTGSTHLVTIVEELRATTNQGNLSKKKLIDSLNILYELGYTIKDNGVRVSKLVQNFKKLATETEETETEVFSLYKLVEEIISHFTVFTNELVHINNEVLESIEIDCSRKALSQVIEHLIQNALQHSEIPLVSLEITIYTNLTDDFVELGIKDNGNGIEEESIHKVFDPFFTTKRHIGSAGLGLHIVYNLIKNQIGGDLEVKNHAGFEIIIKNLPRKKM